MSQSNWWTHTTHSIRILQKQVCSVVQYETTKRRTRFVRWNVSEIQGIIYSVANQFPRKYLHSPKKIPSNRKKVPQPNFLWIFLQISLSKFLLFFSKISQIMSYQKVIKCSTHFLVKFRQSYQNFVKFFIKLKPSFSELSQNFPKILGFCSKFPANVYSFFSKFSSIPHK